MSKNIAECEGNVVHQHAVDAALLNMPDENEIDTLSTFFKVLGDPTRMRIVCALEGAELCVCDIAAVLGMTKSAISHQLGTLKEANLVRYRRDGRNVFYSLDDQHVTDILKIAIAHARHSHE